MADATTVPQLQLFLWGTPSAPNPTLTSPLEDSATAQTATFSSAPLDSSAAKLTGDFLFAVRNKAGFTEVCYVPAGGMSADGLTATGVIRGINTGGGSIDYTATGGANYRAEHEQGSPVFCAVSSTHHNIILDWIQGTGDMASGGTDLVLGDETDTNVTIKAALTSTVGFIRKNATTGKAQYSNDGAAWVDIDSVTASNLLEVSAADTTPGYLDTKLTVDSDTMAKTITSAGGDERLELSASGGLADIVDDVTATATEINTTIDGTTATAANLNTLVGGSSSDASSLHKHNSKTTTYTAYETIATDDSVCLLPIEVQYYAQLDDEGAGDDIALGDANARRRYAIKVTPSADVATVPNLNMRTRKVGTGAAITVRMETDSAGEPSGTLVDANATANFGIPGAVTYANDSAAWAGAFSISEDTDYWIVIQVAGTDAANYNELSTNASFDENYLTFTRLTYDLNGASWGGSVTNSTPYFWFTTEAAMGVALGQTDASFGGRTWSFIGFAKAGGSAQDDIDVYDDNAADLSGLVAGKNYFISTTAGEITDSPPTPTGSNGTMRYKIGRATSATDLTIKLGEKKTWLATAVSATTTYPIITWFRPLEVDCVNGSAGGGQYWGGQGRGHYDGATNVYYSAATSSTQSLLYNSDRGDGAGTKNTGTGTAVTNAGFTVSNTNSSGTTVIFLTMLG